MKNEVKIQKVNPNSKDFAGVTIVSTPTGLNIAKNPSKILPVAAGFNTTATFSITAI